MKFLLTISFILTLAIVNAQGKKTTGFKFYQVDTANFSGNGTLVYAKDSAFRFDNGTTFKKLIETGDVYPYLDREPEQGEKRVYYKEPDKILVIEKYENGTWRHMMSFH